MPNSPAQLPNIDLPGAEWLSLAPNASIAMGGRRRVVGTTTLQTNPGPAGNILSVNLNLLLENPFPDTAGIYVHYFSLGYFPGLPLGNMQVTGVSASLSVNGTISLPIGNPVLTTPVPTVGETMLYDRDHLFPCRDIQLGGGNTQTLNLQTSLSTTNQTAGALTFQFRSIIIYTRLDGLTE